MITRRATHDTKRTTITAANQLCELRFTFRGSATVQFEDCIDWGLEPDGVTDWRWDLNRHAWFETLGYAWHYSHEAKYAKAFESSLLHWLQNNPVSPEMPNWSAPFEVAYRVNSWTWAWFLFHDCEEIAAETSDVLLRAIGEHCSYLDANLEVHARNNHLLLEAKALLFAAIAFPQFSDAKLWQQRAERLLFDEVRQQVLEDGVHAEMSTHYHRVIAGELLELFILLQRNGIAIPTDVEQRIRLMAEFEQNIVRPDGHLPLFGDSSQNDTYARFPAAAAAPYCFASADNNASGTVPELEEAILWRLPHAKRSDCIVRPAQSKAFPLGGYYIMRNQESGEQAKYMAIDCGPFGLPIDPHHGHADALSFELYALGRPWLVDCGVYSTHTDWEWRQYFRGTRSHNTVMVDGLDQSHLIDSRRADSLAKARCIEWSATPDSDVQRFSGRHDGYARLPNSVIHRRMIWFVRDSFWVITDVLEGTGTHSLELNLHSLPDVEIKVVGDGAAILSDDTRRLVIAFASNTDLQATVLSGALDPVQGWYSGNSGSKTAAPALCLAANSSMPAILCTVIVPDANGTLRPADIQIEISEEQNDTGSEIAVRVGSHQIMMSL